MTKSMIQPLEAYRLARYAVPIPCYVCETDNTYDAEYCTHCGAPMALAHQAHSQGIRPRMVAVMGASGVGKTVYLGMLMDILSRLPQRMQLLARGAFSITLQQNTISVLARCEFPAKTPNEPERWNWVHCQVRRPRQRQPLEIIMPDMAGEALLAEVDHPHTYRVVRAFLAKCAGTLLLIDAERLIDGGPEQELFALKLLSYLAELVEGRRSSAKQHPVALVLTKADRCEQCQDDPAAFAHDHAAGLWQQCRERFPSYRFFAASVAGACAVRDTLEEGRVQVPLRVEPRGIIEPFEWLVENLPPQRAR